MTATIELLKAAKKSAGIKSDYGLAKALKVSTSRISNYMRLTSEIQDEEFLIRIAELAGFDPVEVIAEFHRKRATSPIAAKLWARVAELAKENETHVSDLKRGGKTRKMVAEDGIEPPTRGFSIPCSTN